MSHLATTAAADRVRANGETDQPTHLIPRRRPSGIGTVAVRTDGHHRTLLKINLGGMRAAQTFGCHDVSQPWLSRLGNQPGWGVLTPILQTSEPTEA